MAGCVKSPRCIDSFQKPIISPLGLPCDPLMSIEPLPSPKPQSPKPAKVSPRNGEGAGLFQKSIDENPEELLVLLERRNKINEGRCFFECKFRSDCLLGR